MDFGSLSVPEKKITQTDPIKIFEALPRLDGSLNDLWRGQTDALRKWDQDRNESDVLISLNTGAGKTLAGLLIAQSLVNEGLNNVLYVCPTNDLVLQTKNEAERSGIKVTTRMEQGFDNDLFEIGQAFCITNYQAVFNGLSSLRKKHFPEAIIFDDAHVAESVLRGSFTLTLNSIDDEELYFQLANLILPSFDRLGRGSSFRDSFKRDRTASATTLVPPDVIVSLAGDIFALFERHGMSKHKTNKWVYPHLRDHLQKCAFVFRGGRLEVTPPFLPSLALDVFSEKVRRIYLSATLQNKADIVRAFGRHPSVLIEPENDAGNGERLIIQERELNGVKIDKNFVSAVANEHKLVLAVSSYREADKWKDLAEPPSREQFTAALNAFRSAEKGIFVLVSRTDGIDLPHDTCRVMVIDGLPTGENALEKYQLEYLRMNNFIASKTANRLVQLFGQVNRGRSDYGGFLLSGHDLNVWLQREQNIARLPVLLRKQIVIGRHVQEGLSIRTLPKVLELFGKVLKSKPRDQGWVAYYSDFLSRYDVSAEEDARARLAEERNLKAAEAESEYALAMWNGDYGAAARRLDEVTADVARSDEKLAGWLTYWSAAAHFLNKDEEEARYLFARAYSQLGNNLVVDRSMPADTGTAAAMSEVATSALALVSLRPEAFEKQSKSLRANLAALDGASPKKMEESVRFLGQILGFKSTRPDNDIGTGPDVAWVDEQAGQSLGLELKTDKEAGTPYFKKEVAQSQNHNSWLDANEVRPMGTVIIGPSLSVASDANPDSRVFQAGNGALCELRDRYFAAVDRLRGTRTDDRQSVAVSLFERGWSLQELHNTYFSKLLSDLPVQV